MSFKKFIKKLCVLDLYNWKLIINEILPKILVTLRIFKVLMLKLMANFHLFQTIFINNFCIWKDKNTTAYFLIVDIETASFIASHCTSISYLLYQTEAHDLMILILIWNIVWLDHSSLLETLQNFVVCSTTQRMEISTKYVTLKMALFWEIGQPKVLQSPSA